MGRNRKDGVAGLLEQSNTSNTLSGNLSHKDDLEFEDEVEKRKKQEQLSKTLSSTDPYDKISSHPNNTVD